jgi:DHA1 family bicyclomycin/chloramphenicol resistance-like MFS transporter
MGLISCLVFCHGFLNPNAIALALQPFIRKAGTAAAFMGSTQMVTGALASALVSYLHDGTAKPMIWIMAGCTAIGLTLLAARAISKASETRCEG